MSIYSKCKHYAFLLRLHKPIGIFLLLWPTLIAVWVASSGQPTLSLTVIFILGVIVMRSAGCIINDIMDHQFDGQVQRTHARPLVTKAVSLKEAWILFAVLILLAFILALQLNTLTLLLACFGLALTMIYPLMKRITNLPQTVLALAFSIAIPMAFAAQLNEVPMVAWYLVMANAFWVVAYDTQYAMVDREEDIKIGVKSTAILFAQYDRWIILALQTVCLLIFLMIGVMLKLGMNYFGCLILATFLVLYQFYLIYDRDPRKCFQAFQNNNLLGACLFLGFLLSY